MVEHSEVERKVILLSHNDDFLGSPFRIQIVGAEVLTYAFRNPVEP